MKNANDVPLPTLTRNIALIGTFVVILTYALCIIPTAFISPEICKQYVFLKSTGTFGEALHKFLVFNETWYRPFQFYMTNYIFFHLIDLHNIYAVKTLSVFLTLVNGFILTRLSRLLYDSSLPEQLIVFCLIVTHPVYYCLAYDGSVQTDIFLNIFMTLFVIQFLRLLEHITPVLGLPPHKVAVRKGRQAALCCILIFCAVTSNERALAVLPMAWLLYAYYHWHQIKRAGFKPEPASGAVIVFGLIILAAYLLIILPVKPHLTGDLYRSGIEPKYIFINLLRIAEWPFRFYFFTGRVNLDPAHSRFLFNALGLPFFVALVGFVISVFQKRDLQERKHLTVLLILFTCSLPIPVLFGGWNWHYYTAAMFLAVATGRAVWFWLSRLLPPMRQRMLLGVFVWLSLATLIGTQEEMQKGTVTYISKSFISMSVHSPTLHALPFAPEVVYFDTEYFGEFVWLFGGDMDNIEGYMFKYLYDNSHIVEIPIVKGRVPQKSAYLCKNVVGKRTAYFGIRRYDLTWHTIPARDYCNMHGGF